MFSVILLHTSLSTLFWRVKLSCFGPLLRLSELAFLLLLGLIIATEVFKAESKEVVLIPFCSHVFMSLKRLAFKYLV